MANKKTRIFDGKRYVFQMKRKSKKYIEQYKDHIKSLIKSPDFKMRFRTVKIKDKGKTWYYLYYRTDIVKKLKK